MTTYLFIGLILLLAAYLVRARRTRSGGDPSPAPAGHRTHKRAATPPAATARAETAATAPAAREPLPAPHPAPPLAETALSWTPEETIVEPGWPLPGEIAGGWSAQPEPPAMPSFPEQPAPPVAVVEWEPAPPAAAPESAGAPQETAAELPDAEDWAMPSFDAGSPLDASSAPPLWVPGETESEIPPSVGADAERPLWPGGPESGAGAEESAAAVSPAPLEAPSVIAWGPPDEIPGSAPDATPIPDGLVWADDSPASSVDEPAPLSWETAAPEAPEAPPAPEAEPEPEPVAAVPPAPLAETEPEPDPVIPAWKAPPEAGDAAAPIAPAPLFGTLTPVPVWPPESAPAAAPAREAGAAEPWAPAPEATRSLQTAAAVPFTRVCDRLGVTPRMLVLLRMLAHTPRSVSEQARELGVSRPLIADLCTRLENIGLVRREPVASDRRRIRITLTAAGHRLCAQTAGSPAGDSPAAAIGPPSPPGRAGRARPLSSLKAHQ